MSADAIGPIGPPSAEAQQAVAPPPVVDERPSFAHVLQQQLERPRSEIAHVRAQVASLRNGGGLRQAATASTTAAPAPADPAPLSAGRAASSADYAREAHAGVAPELLHALGEPSTSGEDPHGWRDMSRTVAESVIGPGYGALFERQIDQESGFHPDVVTGRRVSSAGAEGIAQLMPQYYPGVDRTDPRAALIAGAQSMQHYLTVWDGDVRRALASYNAGLGRVQSLVRAHGEGWERGLPFETQHYLRSIVGPAQPRFDPTTGVANASEHAVFGGRGPGGVLTPPLDQVLDRLDRDGAVELTGDAGAPVRAPADGTVRSITSGSGGATVVIDHGNGWRTRLEGLAQALVAPGDTLRRSDALGAPADAGGDRGRLRLRVLLDGRRLDAGRYLLRQG